MSLSWETMFLDLQKQVDELFDKLIYQRWSVRGKVVWQPPIDLFDTGDSYLVILDVPGVPANEIEILVSRMDVSIKGSRSETVTGDAQLLQRERALGRFERSLRLTEPIRGEDAFAIYSRGTIQIRLPKHPGISRTPVARSEQVEATHTMKIDIQVLEN